MTMSYFLFQEPELVKKPEPVASKPTMAPVEQKTLPPPKGIEQERFAAIVVRYIVFNASSFVVTFIL